MGDNNSLYVFMSNNKVFCTMYRFPGENTTLLDAAFASGVQGMIISDYPNAQNGDIWDGTQFIKNSPERNSAIGERVALLVDNEIVDILDLEKEYPYYERWINGFSGPHVGFNATGYDYDTITPGSTWDGEKFTLPLQELN